MTKIDVISGFLGAGKTTLIKKLLKEALDGTKVVLIENEFGEIGIDGGFLKEAGIEIKEMNSGCICCSLVGDFGASLKEVLSTYAPERVLIEPSGVGKLSDVIKAVENVAGDLDVEINSAVAVVDASKCKMYMKNFGEFFLNQIEYAGTILLSRGDKVSLEKMNESVELIRKHNPKATIITTSLDQLDGKAVLDTIEGADKLEDMVKDLMDKAKQEKELGHHHAQEGSHEDHAHGECCGHEHHHQEQEGSHKDHGHGECCGHGHHHQEQEGSHEGHTHGECCGHGHHHQEQEGSHKEHGHEECCGHGHHHHHHADEVFTSWGMETPNEYSKEEIEQILTALDSGEYGMILRAKGMVPAGDGTWNYYDYVPQEHDIRAGKPEVTGKICVIGSNLVEEKLESLFRK